MKTHVPRPWSHRPKARTSATPVCLLPLVTRSRATQWPSLPQGTPQAMLRNDGAPVLGAGAHGKQLRIALYSHDAMGLGHMRRNLLIARTLAAPPVGATVLMLAGASEANVFAMPPGVDSLTLPALRKDVSGRYHSRSLRIELQELISLRSSAIHAALKAFCPDVLIVDKVPRGMNRELDPALSQLRDRGQTLCVLGLRDVLDEPEAVRREWRQSGNEQAISRYYDAVWVYGDPRLYDPVREYGFSRDIAEKVRYTGYLDRRIQLPPQQEQDAEMLKALNLSADASLCESRLMLCLVGGGQDGALVAEAFAGADLPTDAIGVVLTGPHMPHDAKERLRRLAEERPRLRVLEFVSEPSQLLSRADRVVAMGGYNTTFEILSFCKPALIIPRTKPRLEQWIRAERLSQLGLLDVLHPDKLNSNAISKWLAAPRRPVQAAHEQLDMEGLSRLPTLLDELIALSSRNSSLRFTEGTWHVSS